MSINARLPGHSPSCESFVSVGICRAGSQSREKGAGLMHCLEIIHPETAGPSPYASLFSTLSVFLLPSSRTFEINVQDRKIWQAVEEEAEI